MTRDEPVIVARIARAHGIRGAVLLDAETDHAEALFQTGRRLLVVEGPSGPRPKEEPPVGHDLTPTELAVTVHEARPHNDRWLVQLSEIPDRTAAETLRGAGLAVPRSELPDMPDDGYLLNDLIGMTVIEDATPVGVVRDVYDLPAGPTLGVDVDGRERLIPFETEIVSSVDPAEGAVHVTLPKGLLDI